MTSIAIFIPDLSGGGAEQVMLKLAAHLQKKNIETTIIVARKNGPLLNAAPENCQLHDLSHGKSYRSSFALGILSIVRLVVFLKQRKPTALISTVTGANICAAIAHMLSGRLTRLVIRNAVPIRNETSFLKRHLQKLCYRHASVVISLNDTMQQEMVTRLGIKKNKSLVISNPVDLHEIERMATEPLPSRWRRHAVEKGPIILAIGRLVEQKDYRTLIQAFAPLAHQKLAQLVILGEGQLLDELKSLAHKLGIQSHVHFVGFDTNPYRWLSACSLYVLSSKWEGSPNSLLEAAAMGCNIVCTRYDDSVIEFGKLNNVKLVDCGDIEALSKSMLLLLNTPPATTSRPINTPNDKIFEQYMSALLPGHQPNPHE